jgi:glycosyltransferase involved in cell wall biosynthesis
MKIAIITSGILPVPAVLGGAVENLIDYALEYNDNTHKHEIDVYSIYHHKVKINDALKSAVNHYAYINTNSIYFKLGAKLYSYLGKQYCYNYKLEYFFEQVWKRMKSQHYDLIILENRPGFALKLKERTNTPIISHIHTNILYEPSSTNISIAKITDRFLAVSNYIKNEILKVDGTCDVRVVYNGLDCSKFNINKSSTISRSYLGLKEDDFIAIFWGRLVPRKGIKELLEAFTLLKEYQDIKLIVIGSINYEDTDKQTNPFIAELKQIAEKLNNSVVFTGYVPYNQIPSYLSLSNVAIVPSMINEAFGMTCIEACAMGLPVIATDDGGIPETLQGQKHIIINKSMDISIQLKEAILHIRNNYSNYIGNRISPLFTKEEYVKSFFDNIELQK